MSARVQHREKAAQAARTACKEFDRAVSKWLALPEGDRITGTKKGGEMMRASMTLTRALSRLRNPWRGEP